MDCLWRLMDCLPGLPYPGGKRESQLLADRVDPWPVLLSNGMSPVAPVENISQRAHHGNWIPIQY